MSHLHIPDGVLPLWLVLLGWLLTGVILFWVSRILARGERGRQLPLLGVMSAVMLVGMSTEIVPIAYHTNLSVLAGIVLGPALGFMAALMVNLILALFGHGGITVVGFNTLVVGSESVLGHYLFQGLWRVLKGRQRSPALAAALATAITLVISTSLMIGVVGLSNLDPSSRAAISPEHLSFRNPLEHGFLATELGQAESGQTASQPPAALDLFGFAKLVFALALLGWVLEAALTGAIAGFVHKVRPDLIGGRSAVLEERAVGRGEIESSNETDRERRAG